MSSAEPSLTLSSLQPQLPPRFLLERISVISSSAINRKVKRTLQLLDLDSASQSDPAAVPSTSTPHGMKRKRDADPEKGDLQTVVILQAKAPVASKLISIVEIVKRVSREGATDAGVVEDGHEVAELSAGADVDGDAEMAEMGDTDARQKTSKRRRKKDHVLFQYTAMHGVPGAKKRDESMLTAKAKRLREEGRDGAAAEDDGAGNDGVDEYFEQLRRVEVAKETRVEKTHDVPVLTVYLCRKSVRQLEEAFGEQVV